MRLGALLCGTMALTAAGLANENSRGLKMASAEVVYSESRQGLIIGNSRYALGALRNPVNDAQAVATLLRERKFNVDLRFDASKRMMLEAVESFGRRIRKGGVGFFYYAGHGMQVDGHNYLIPVDADIKAEADLEFEGFDVGRLLTQMAIASNRLNIVVLDACRDNPFERSFRTVKTGLAQMDAPDGTLIAYATAPGSTAADGTAGDHSVYTKYLLAEFATPGLEIGKAFKNVRMRVRDETGKRQIPWESTSLTGDFYFTPVDGEEEIPDIPPAGDVVGIPTAATPIQSGKDLRLDLGAGMMLELVWIKELGGWVGKYEITNGEYRRFKPEHDSKSYEAQSLDGDRQPAVFVSYGDALAFCSWLNQTARLPAGYAVRLPDGKEWTKFAQAGDNRDYPWGNEWPPKYGNYADATAQRHLSGFTPIEGYNDRADVSCPVEESGRNDWGLYGVGGNVWEWTTESDGMKRVLRGASWGKSSQVYLRCDLKFRCHPTIRQNSIGFRIVVLP